MNKKSLRTWKMTLTTPPSDAGSKLPYWEIIAGSDGQPGEVVSITEDLPKPSMAFEEAYDIMKERQDKLLSALDAAYNQIKLVPNYSKNQDLVEALQAIDDARKENQAAQGFEE